MAFYRDREGRPRGFGRVTKDLFPKSTQKDSTDALTRGKKVPANESFRALTPSDIEHGSTLHSKCGDLRHGQYHLQITETKSPS